MLQLLKTDRTMPDQIVEMTETGSCLCPYKAVRGLKIEGKRGTVPVRPLFMKGDYKVLPHRED